MISCDAMTNSSRQSIQAFIIESVHFIIAEYYVAFYELSILWSRHLKWSVLVNCGLVTQFSHQFQKLQPTQNVKFVQVCIYITTTLPAGMLCRRKLWAVFCKMLSELTNKRATFVMDKLVLHAFILLIDSSFRTFINLCTVN